VLHRQDRGSVQWASSVQWLRIPTTPGPLMALSTKLYQKRLKLSRFALAIPVHPAGSHPHFSRTQTLPLLPLQYCRHQLYLKALIFITPLQWFQKSPVSPRGFYYRSATEQIGICSLRFVREFKHHWRRRRMPPNRLWRYSTRRSNYCHSTAHPLSRK